MTRIDYPTRPAISALDIAEQARLFRVERQALGWARYGYASPIHHGVNAVRQICNGEAAHAYFKRGDGAEVATSRMEKLVWDLAVLFGRQALFVPTKLCRLREPEESIGGPESALLWRPDQTHRWTDKARAATLGSLQAHVAGLDLFEARADGHEESLEHAANATLGILLMGGWDAHCGNIMVQADGSYRLFDNSRSLPPNNDFHLYGEELRVPYRNALCSADVYYETFSPQLREQLSAQIQQLQERCEAVRAYFASPQVQRQLDTLPPGWWSKGCEEALYQRVERMAAAICKPEVKNLRDLSMAVFPQLRLAALISLAPYLLHDRDVERVQRNFLAHAGVWSLANDLAGCVNAGISPRKLKDYAASGLDFDQALTALVDDLRKNTVSGQSARRELYTLHEEMTALAQVQLKDIAREHCSRFIDLRQWAEERFQDYGGLVVYKREDLDHAGLTQRCCILNLETSSLLARWNSEGELQLRAIDCTSRPGFIVSGTEAWTPLELARYT